MGDSKRRHALAKQQVVEALGLETAGGRLQVRWNDGAQATPQGQMAFFIEFLTITGLFAAWLANCPLTYGSPNGSSLRDILGTWLMSILSGHWRYAHVTAIRADGVNPQLWGMSRVVSEDTLRRALAAMDEATGVAWLNDHLDRTVRPLLKAPWILDMDVTVKPIYGRQEGAVVGYNPKKPGRPSHAYHTYQVSGLRLLLGVDVSPGNATHANHTLPGLLALLDRLPKEQRPQCVRGDAGTSGEPTLAGLDERHVHYLFKLRQTQNVKRHIERTFFGAGWTDAGQGWEGKDGQLRLHGWSRARRVVVLRRRLKGEVLVADDRQQELAFIEKGATIKAYEFAVLVTDLPHEILTLAQLYRDRGDAENTFDELKNQWGWGGFTTTDLKRCQLSALAVALVYNWWSLFVRLGHPKARLEAITSRPLLLSAVAQRTTHAGQQHLLITPQHGDAPRAKNLLTTIHGLLKQFKQRAEQLRETTVWQLVCDHLIETVTGFRRGVTPLLPPPPPTLVGANCGF